MPLIEPTKRIKATKRKAILLYFSLDDFKIIEKYCKWVECSHNEFLRKAALYILNNDTDFHEYMKKKIKL